MIVLTIDAQAYRKTKTQTARILFMTTIQREEALKLLQEAISRIEKSESDTKHHGKWLCGGAYWRLAKVLTLYLLPNLEQQEGKEHTEFILKNHGQIMTSDTNTTN